MRVYRLVVWGRELFAWEIDGALEITLTNSDQDVDESELDEETPPRNNWWCLHAV